MNKYSDAYQKNFSKNVELSGRESTLFAAHKADIIDELVKNVAYSPLSILDFGCSDGLLTSFIQILFSNARITAVDKSYEHIEVARLAYPSINFEMATTSIPSNPNLYDLVIVCDVLHHIPKKEHPHYIQEFIRALKPGGLCIIIELNPLNFYTKFNFTCTIAQKNISMLNHWYLQKLLRPYGLIATQFHYSNLFTRLPWCKRLPFGALYSCTLIKQIP